MFIIVTPSCIRSQLYNRLWIQWRHQYLCQLNCGSQLRYYRRVMFTNTEFDHYMVTKNRLEADTKWTSFYRRQFQIHFFGWNLLYLKSNFIEFIPKVSINNKVRLVQMRLVAEYMTNHYLNQQLFILLMHVCVTQPRCQCSIRNGSRLTHLLLDKKAAILQMIFSNASSWMKNFVFWFESHWSLFLGLQFTVSHHWFR